MSLKIGARSADFGAVSAQAGAVSTDFGAASAKLGVYSSKVGASSATMGRFRPDWVTVGKCWAGLTCSRGSFRVARSWLTQSRAKRFGTPRTSSAASRDRECTDSRQNPCQEGPACFMGAASPADSGENRCNDHSATRQRSGTRSTQARFGRCWSSLAKTRQSWAQLTSA